MLDDDLNFVKVFDFLGFGQQPLLSLTPKIKYSKYTNSCFEGVKFKWK